MKRTVLALTCLCLSVFVVGTAEFLIAGLLPQIGTDLRVSIPVPEQAVAGLRALGAVIAGPVVALATVRLLRIPAQPAGSSAEWPKSPESSNQTFSELWATATFQRSSGPPVSPECRPN
ncbi:hypothetical protein [Nonomuraea candida]|uniref:hypothetical protein n=1 Tax=Nonomuraea candida TaxID=359159 RepID=UPI0012FB87F1|nr:hypothetical protein [Nonomuraea candida]